MSYLFPSIRSFYRLLVSPPLSITVYFRCGLFLLFNVIYTIRGLSLYFIVCIFIPGYLYAHQGLYIYLYINLSLSLPPFFLSLSLSLSFSLSLSIYIYVHHSKYKSKSLNLLFPFFLYIYIYIYIYIYPGFNPRPSDTRYSKNITCCSLLKTQHCNLRFNGKWSNPGKVLTSPTPRVVAIEKVAFRLRSTTVGQLL